MPLFLIHGWATNAAIWPDWLTANSSCCYESPHYPDYSHLEESFLNVYQHYGRPLTIIGWSLGGMLALQLAAAYPEKIKKLILISSTPRFTMCENYTAGLAPSIVKNLARRIPKNKWQTQLDFYKLMFSDKEQLWENKFTLEMAPLLECIEIPTLQAGLRYLSEKDLRGILTSIQIPCHILHGTEDTICLPAAGQYLATMLPNATLTLIPGAGHIPFYTQGEYCKAHINMK